MAGLTQKQIEAFKVPEGEERIFVWDPAVPGFGVIVNAGGRRTFFIQYRTRANKTRRYTVGRADVLALDAARRKAKVHLAQVADGRDPFEEEEREKERAAQASTLGEYWERNFLPNALTRWRSSTAKEMQRLWGKRIAPELGDIRLEELTPSHVEKWLNGLADIPGGANVALRLLRAVCNHAVKHEAISKSPTRHAKEFKRPKMERFLSPRETASLLDAIEEEVAIGREGKKAIVREGEAVKGTRGGKGLKETASRGMSVEAGAALRLLLLTGARRDEIRLAEWSWLDWDNAALVLPEAGSKTGARRVPLSKAALEIILPLWTAQGKPSTGWMFPGLDPTKPVDNLRKPFLRACERAGIKDLRIHDLRHSAASILIASGASLRVVGGVLGHKSERTTSRYAHLSDDTIAAAAELLGRSIKETQASGGGAEVIEATPKVEETTRVSKKGTR